jgi:hypothetical protein
MIWVAGMTQPTKKKAKPGAVTKVLRKTKQATVSAVQAIGDAISSVLPGTKAKKRKAVKASSAAAAKKKKPAPRSPASKKSAATAKKKKGK